MNRGTLYLSLLLSVCFFIGINAQEPVQLHFTEQEGLPDKEFYNVAEDSKGFIWLAGNKGLTRFDGTSFVTLEHPEKKGLSVFQLKIDEQDRVWCINVSGQLFYSDGDTLHLFKDVSADLRGALPTISVSTNYVTLATDMVLLQINKRTKQVTRTTRERNLAKSFPTVHNDLTVTYKENRLSEIFPDGTQSMYTTPLTLAPPSEKRLGNLRLTPLNQKSLLLYSFNEQLEQLVYIISEHLAQEVSVPQVLKGKEIVTIKAIDNVIWWLTNRGAYILKLENGIATITNMVLPEHYVTDVSKDIEGNIWLTTLRDGLFILPNLNIKRIAFPSDLGSLKRMTEGRQGELLLGFSSGDVLIYNTSSKAHTRVDLPTERNISSFLYDKHREEYVFLQDIFSYQAPVSNPNKFKKSDFKKVSVKEIIQLSTDKYAFVTSGEVSIGDRMSLQQGKPSRDNMFFEKKRGYTVFEDLISKDIYFATVDKLLVVDDNGEQREIKNTDGYPILAQSITQTTDGCVWIATFTNGLYKIRDNKVLKHYTTKTGLLSNRTTVVASQDNNIWLATDQGLQYLKRNEGLESFTSLKRQDGILSYDINGIVPTEETVYVATGDGLFLVDSKRAFKPYVPATLYITDVRINNIGVPIQSAYEIDQEESNIIVRFNANGFRGLSSGNFKYRLKGFDKDWRQLRQGTNTVQYASLPAGNFSFELTTAGEQSLVQNPISFDIKVTQPFYKSLLFFLLVAGAIVLAVILYYRSRLAIAEKKRAKDNATLQLASQMTALKLENLQSQMNPHFIFNALNSIQDYIVHNEKGLASSYLVKFSRLIRMYLDQSRENLVTLEEELAAMRLYLQLEKVRFEDKLVYTITVDPSATPQVLHVPPLFIQPYVENALKHGLLHREGGGKLGLLFTYENDAKILEVRIEDNGVGRAAAQQIKSAHPQYHKSFATYANTERVMLLNKHLDRKITVVTQDLYEGDTATGTRIVIRIPQ